MSSLDTPLLCTFPLDHVIQVQVTDRMIAGVMVPSIGISLAVAQWLLMRLHFPRAAWWLPATFLGWTTPIFLLVTVLPISQATQQAQVATLLASAGVTMGCLQFLVLRPHRPRSAWWVLASALGWLLLAFSLPIPIQSQFAILAVGAVPAAVTGMAFVTIIVSARAGRIQPTLANAA